MSTESVNDSIINIRGKFGRFRVLIIGRANAGKTTILRGICDSTENPEIYDGDGNKVCVQPVMCYTPNRGIRLIPPRLKDPEGCVLRIRRVGLKRDPTKIPISADSTTSRMS